MNAECCHESKHDAIKAYKYPVVVLQIAQCPISKFKSDHIPLSRIRD
jgi:hypothetical protein